MNELLLTLCQLPSSPQGMSVNAPHILPCYVLTIQIVGDLSLKRVMKGSYLKLQKVPLYNKIVEVNLNDRTLSKLIFYILSSILVL